MSKKIKQEDMNKNCIQSENTTKNQVSLQNLMNEIRTIEIYSTDIVNIEDFELLEKCKDELETHLSHLKVCLNSIIGKLEDISLDYLSDSVKDLKEHPYGFHYTSLGNNEIVVTERERIRYTKSKPITFQGKEIELNGIEYPIYIDDFTECIEKGGEFFQTDMFGNKRTVTNDELIEFIREHYNY
jgi:hypothetical protein